MTEVKIFKIERKFNCVEALYKWLRENIDVIEKLAGLQIQAPLRNRILCMTAKEKRIASRGRMGDSIVLCEQDEQVNQKTRLTRATKEITERNILFYASKQDFPESLGELMVIAGAFDIDIIIFFIQKLTKTKLEPLNWLSKISNDDTEIIVFEAEF